MILIISDNTFQSMAPMLPELGVVVVLLVVEVLPAEELTVVVDSLAGVELELVETVGFRRGKDGMPMPRLEQKMG